MTLFWVISREAASQAFVAGTPLTLVAGLLTTGGEDVVADIVGVAAEDASGVTNTLLLFYPVSPNVIWEGTLEDQGTVGHALVIANIGTDYGVKKDDNELYYIDENETTNKCVHIIAPRDDEDVTNAVVRARVKFTFHTTALAGNT